MHLSNPALLTDETYVPGLPRESVAETYGVPLDDVLNWDQPKTLSGHHRWPSRK